MAVRCVDYSTLKNYRQVRMVLWGRSRGEPLETAFWGRPQVLPLRRRGISVAKMLAIQLIEKHQFNRDAFKWDLGRKCNKCPQ